MDADSLDMVEIIICIEEGFDISIADEAARHMETVGDFVEHIDQQRAKHAKH